MEYDEILRKHNEISSIKVIQSEEDKEDFTFNHDNFKNELNCNEIHKLFVDVTRALYLVTQKTIEEINKIEDDNEDKDDIFYTKKLPLDTKLIKWYIDQIATRSLDYSDRENEYLYEINKMLSEKPDEIISFLENCEDYELDIISREFPDICVNIFEKSENKAYEIFEESKTIAQEKCSECFIDFIEETKDSLEEAEVRKTLKSVKDLILVTGKSRKYTVKMIDGSVLLKDIIEVLEGYFEKDVEFNSDLCKAVISFKDTAAIEEFYYEFRHDYKINITDDDIIITKAE